MAHATLVDIVDIRADNPFVDHATFSIRQQLVTGLSQLKGSKHIPNVLLYDERGLRLYDQFSQAIEYYLFPAEERILKIHADEIVKTMGFNSVEGCSHVVELGAGALRKTSIILQELARRVTHPSPVPPITYYALDLDERELARTLTELSQSEVGAEISGKIATRGLCGTYDDGVALIARGSLRANRLSGDFAVSPRVMTQSSDRDNCSHPTLSSTNVTQSSDATSMRAPHEPLHMLFLGSSISNFTRGEDAAFLKSLPLRPGSSDTLLIGMDHCDNAERIKASYNDHKGLTRSFILNGLVSAGRTLGDDTLFDQQKWESSGRYNEELHCYGHYYRSKCDQILTDPVTSAVFSFVKDELVRVAFSHKYSDDVAYSLFTEAGLQPIRRWVDSETQYSLWLLNRPEH
ncbi:histidine-specific methyltransferase [Daedaleopsis nitida]|nr:histidine-specific methyltransferase [Daedaleopsis nitida]